MTVKLGLINIVEGQSNETLSAKKVKASAEYIKNRISNPERIYGKGCGESIHFE